MDRQATTGQGILGLHHDQPVEVIVSTNTTRAATPGEAKTYTTAVGELRAVAVGARTVLPLYRNSYAGRLIDYLNRQYPSARLHLDARANEIGVGGDPIRFDQRREVVFREKILHCLHWRLRRTVSHGTSASCCAPGCRRTAPKALPACCSRG